MSAHLTEDQVLSRAASAVTKIDLLGERGLSLVTYEEIEALAVIVIHSGVLPSIEQRREAGTYPEYRTLRKERA